MYQCGLKKEFQKNVKCNKRDVLVSSTLKQMPQD
jgi:hypothetical protein